MEKKPAWIKRLRSYMDTLSLRKELAIGIPLTGGSFLGAAYVLDYLKTVYTTYEGKYPMCEGPLAAFFLLALSVPPAIGMSLVCDGLLRIVEGYGSDKK